MSKEDKLYNYLTMNLDGFSTFSEKHAFLTNRKFGSKEVKIDDIYDKYPELKSRIADYMWSAVENQFGNPESDEFTFSKTISDEKLLSIIDNMGLNRKVLANKLEKRGFSTDISTAIDDVNDLINEKNQRWKTASKIVSERKQAADTIYREGEGFGRSLTTSALAVGAIPLLIAANVIGSPVEYIKRLGDDIKYGNINKPWTDKMLDAFSRPGEATKINMNMMNYNPETGKLGYPEHYEKATASLTEAYDVLDDIKYDPKYNDASAIKPYLDDYLALEENYAETIKKTGIDEALLYIEGENKLEKLKTMLEDK